MQLPSRTTVGSALRHLGPLPTRRAVFNNSWHRGRASLVTTAARGLHSLKVEKDPGGSLFLTSREARRHELSNTWLRDNCRCKDCVNQDTMQRNVDVFELSSDIAPTQVAQDNEGVEVTWTDSHRSRYPWSWLAAAIDPSARQETSELNDKKKLWDSSIASNPPDVAFEDVMNGTSSKGMAELTRNIITHGFSFVSNTPVTPEATEKLLESIGPIRHTHYGGFYDFVPDLSLADTAYTNLALGAHTDTTYFTEPAGLQAFHMLSHVGPSDSSSADEALGGMSLLVDGFKVADQLRRESPEAYELLRNVKVPWHASGNVDVAIAPDADYPVVETDGDRLKRVRWNNDDRGILPPTDETARWYKAAQKWTSLLKAKENEYWFQLQPGRVLIFDNWRVLHGRSAFVGLRRICGAYVTRDDFMSRWRLTNFPREQVILGNVLSKSAS